MAAVERLKRRRDFLRVSDVRRKWVAPGLILQAMRRVDAGAAESGRMRVGFTASRRVGNAVARNRARRRLRAVVHELLERHAAPGHDYVIIARSGTLTRPYGGLLEDLTGALQRLGLYRVGNDESEAGPAARRTAEV